MPNNTITVGQQHYQWKINNYAWLSMMECVVVNVIDPQQQLYLIIEGNDEEVYRLENLKLWVNYAITQGWYSDKKIYRIVKKNNQPQIIEQPQSLLVEQHLAHKLAQKYGKTVSPLAKSELVHQLSLLDTNLQLELPTLLKQLYIHLGNGNFGPDYGFLSIYEDKAKPKITILEAYQDLHNQSIKDWDWNLPKHFVPFLYWGSDIYSVLDCSSPQAGVWVLDENLKTKDNHWRHCFWQHCDSLHEWLQKWETAGEETGRTLWLEMYQKKGLL